MANDNKKKQIAQQFAELCERVSEIFHDVNQAVLENQQFGIDWATAQDHTAIVDEDGNIAGQNFSPADLSNAIGSLAALQTWGGTHIGNITKLAEAN